MNPGLRSTTYDVNDLFSTSSKELSKKSIRLMTILQNTDNYIIHIYIYYTYYCIYIYIYFYMFGHTPKIYSTYLMFGWSFHVFTVPKAYFLEEQTDFIFTLHLKVQDQKY